VDFKYERRVEGEDIIGMRRKEIYKEKERNSIFTKRHKKLKVT
jgi:hypothetical protein